MAASTAGGQVAAAVSRTCDEELSQDGAEAQVPKWEEPGTVESQEITPNCLLQQGVLLIWFLQGLWKWSKFLFSLLYGITKTGKERPPTSGPLTYLTFPSETFEQEYVKWEPGLRPSPRVDEFFNQLKERRLFHSSKIFLPGVKTLLLWIYTRTAKINGMGDPSRDLLIRRQGSLKSSQIPALMAIWPTPTHKQQRLFCLPLPSSLLPGKTTLGGLWRHYVMAGRDRKINSYQTASLQKSSVELQPGEGKVPCNDPNFLQRSAVSPHA